ncbi:hypothetical protein LTR09_010946 [Extremus antarcticus]|uniref:Uncharacterized protein n=1 Tax=Extremus antarcticus TaxID=702011 RepID=A0AAJ0D719_9PEZI|nr:hypothetical protein LTR09_010946 [Extremus antarcticus]
MASQELSKISLSLSKASEQLSSISQMLSLANGQSTNAFATATTPPHPVVYRVTEQWAAEGPEEPEPGFVPKSRVLAIFTVEEQAKQYAAKHARLVDESTRYSAGRTKVREADSEGGGGGDEVSDEMTEDDGPDFEGTMRYTWSLGNCTDPHGDVECKVYWFGVTTIAIQRLQVVNRMNEADEQYPLTAYD